MPGFVGTEVIGTNNRDKIVGRYLETNLEKSHGFIATPKNEPKSKSRLLVSNEMTDSLKSQNDGCKTFTMGGCSVVKQKSTPC